MDIFANPGTDAGLRATVGIQSQDHMPLGPNPDSESSGAQFQLAPVFEHANWVKYLLLVFTSHETSPRNIFLVPLTTHKYIGRKMHQWMSLELNSFPQAIHFL